jgi:hypothetical protein
MRKIGLYFILICALLDSCSDEGINQRPEPAYFTLAQIKNSNPNGRASSINETSTEFRLGDIKASKEFLFLLGNGGDNSIFNVKLETSNPKFTISPQTISVLEGKSSTNNSIIPLVSLGVLHGPQLNGVGYTELLPMGENEVTISISGKVIENGDSVEVSSIFDVTVNAKQMDIKLYSNDLEIDFSNSNAIGQWIGLEFESGLPSIPGYDFNPSNLKIKNTGNVEISLSLSNLASGPDTIRMVLQPNQLEPINLPVPIGDYYFALFELNGNGTITDRSRIRLGTNGKGYLILQHYN